ncbi:MAG: hypothetical protein Q7R34_01570 [Dehalococcoidia bacterium]|nr:hypothetical protein [Dehalococcoidia bacterium]
MSIEFWDKSEKSKLAGKVPVRVFNAVARAYDWGGLDKPLERLTTEELKKIRQLGSKGIRQIRAALGDIGVPGPCRLSQEAVVSQKLKEENKALRQQVKELNIKNSDTVEMLSQASDFRGLKELDGKLNKLLAWHKSINYIYAPFGLARESEIKFSYSQKGKLTLTTERSDSVIEFSDEMVSELIDIVGEIKEHNMQIQDLIVRLKPLKSLVETAAAVLDSDWTSPPK